MTKEQQQIREFMSKAGQQSPSKPTIADERTRILRVKLLLEEVLELAEASGVEITVNSVGVHDSEFILLEKGEYHVGTDSSAVLCLVGIADALADIKYVCEGAACSFGLDLEPIFNEVHSSNMTKFIDGHRREDGKWVKGPSYRPADLKQVVEKQLA